VPVHTFGLCRCRVTWPEWRRLEQDSIVAPQQRCLKVPVSIKVRHQKFQVTQRARRLFDVVGNIHVRLMRFFYLGLSFEPYGPTLVAEHISLVEAICKRDTGEARRMAAEHISKAIERSASLLMGAIRFGEAVFEADPETDSSRLNSRASVRRI